jgi:3-isopropylmalate/(R)-2-methylmalate dehydratase small subunit
VIATAADIKALSDAVNADPSLEVKIDLEKERVFYGSQNFPITSPATAREALVSGHWDAIGELLEGKDAVAGKMHELGWV